MATIITKNGSGSAVPTSLVQGELAINVDEGKLFYGSGSGNAVRTITASLAITASYAMNGGGGGGTTVKAGAVSSESFGGSPFTSSVTFGTAYGDTQYAVTLTGEDDRIYVVNNKQTTGFVINTNSSTLFTGSVYWMAVPYNN